MDSTILNPTSRFTPEHRRTPSLSPSRSPRRRRNASSQQDPDALLSNPSPAAMLEALTTPRIFDDEKERGRNSLRQVVARASSPERSWGIKAASAAKKIGEWYDELRTCPWPIPEEKSDNGIVASSLATSESTLAEDADSSAHLNTASYGEITLLQWMQTWRSPPNTDFESHEERVRSIVDGLEALEFAKIRNRVLSSYVSSNSYGHDERLDDFTLLITATVVQILPTLSNLEALLDSWTMRFTVRRLVPEFLRLLDITQQNVESAWAALESGEVTKAFFSRSRRSLENKISLLRQRLDQILDAAEDAGHGIPSRWPDALGILENEFADWVVEAESRLLRNELGEKDYTLDPGEAVPIDHSNEVLEATIASRDRSLGHDGSADFDQTSHFIPTSGTHSPRIENMTARQPSVRKPSPLVLDKSTYDTESGMSSEISSETSQPGSATSDYFSRESTPEIKDASMEEYFVGTPVRVNTPGTPFDFSRHSSQRTERGDRRLSMNDIPTPANAVASLAQRSRASSFIPDTTILEDLDSVNEVEEKKEAELERTLSGASTVRGSNPNNHHGHWLRDHLNARQSAELKHMEQEIMSDRPMTPTSRLRLKEAANKSSEQVRTPEVYIPTTNGHSLAGNHQHTPQPKYSPPIPPKSRHRFEEFSDLTPGVSSVAMRRRNTADGSNGGPPVSRHPEPAMPVTPKRSNGDQLEERINSILTKIPAPIRLMSGPEPDAAEISNSGSLIDLRTPAKSSAALRLNRAQTSTTPPSLTLAPAQAQASRSRTQNGEPEIKLYHLHQSGRAAPIKLYVRLVGEGGERVMVRIGGGWADLSQYLKEYASHHGRRSVSDGKFEIQGLPDSLTSSPANAKSRPGTPIEPVSYVGRMRRLSDAGSPTEAFAPSMQATSSSIKSSSRPSTSHSQDSPLGLAGPNTKAVEVSPSKQKWVDGMIDQARKVTHSASSSAEKKKGPNKEFGDLGKIGGIKRVFMRSKMEDRV